MLSIEISSAEGDRTSGVDTGGEAVPLTDSYTPPPSRSMNPSSRFSSHQVALATAQETKIAPGDPLPLSSASLCCTIIPTAEKPSQCSPCLGPHAAGLLVSEAERDRSIQVWEKNFQAPEAKRQYWSSRNRGSRSPPTFMTTARVFNTEMRAPSMDTMIGTVPTASEPKKNPGTSRGQTFPGTLFKRPPPDPKPKRTPDF